MKVIPYQVRKADNWMYLVVDEGTNEAAVVDPWDHEQMAQKVKEHGVNVGRSHQLILRLVWRSGGTDEMYRSRA